jgi:hypothetical protein
VISVQAIVLSLESSQIRRNHNRLKSLSFFFSPALSEKDQASAGGAGTKGKVANPSCS